MSDHERPDPLAPPEGYGQRAPRDSSPAIQLFGVCSAMRGEHHCPGPVAVVWWIACTKAEHAGPVEYCACCADRFRGGVLGCGQCLDATGVLERVRVLKITGPDGVTPLPGADSYVQAQLRQVLDD